MHGLRHRVLVDRAAITWKLLSYETSSSTLERPSEGIFDFYLHAHGMQLMQGRKCKCFYASVGSNSIHHSAPAQQLAHHLAAYPWISLDVAAYPFQAQ